MNNKQQTKDRRFVESHDWSNNTVKVWTGWGACVADDVDPDYSPLFCASPQLLEAARKVKRDMHMIRAVGKKLSILDSLWEQHAGEHFRRVMDDIESEIDMALTDIALLDLEIDRSLA
jgi:hypothetical protein